MRFFTTRRRVWRMAVYTVCILLVLVALDLLWARSLRGIHPGYTTTRIVAPVQPNGLIDYLTPLEEHFSQGVTPDNNAAPLLLQALGPAAIASDQPAGGVAARLHMPELPATGDYFITWRSFAESREGASLEPFPAENWTSQPWPLKLTPLALQWLETNEKALAMVVAATRRPTFCLPYNAGHRPEMLFYILLPHVHPAREAGIALIIRGVHRLESDDIAGAREDLLAAHRLARLLGQAPTLVERAVGYSLENMACKADRAAIASGKLDVALLREFSADLSALPELNSPAECIEISERFLILDAVQYLAHSNPREAGKLYNSLRYSGVPAEWFAFLPIPYERTMVEANQWCDGLALALRQPTFVQRRDAINRWERGVAATGTGLRTLLTPDGLLGGFMPSQASFSLAWESSRAEARLTQAAAALALYLKDRSAYPQSLAELPSVPPTDPYTDRPLIYSRTKNGYSLHSVGPNLIDEGGNTKPPADDIAADVSQAN